MTIAVLSITLILYTLMETLGLFGPAPATLRQSLHTYPFLGLATVLTAVCVGKLLSRMVASRQNRGGRLLTIIGLILIPLGLWLSYLMHFDATVVRMEKQDFLTLPGEYDELAIHKGRWAKPNSIGLFINGVTFRKVPFLDVPVPEADVRYISKTQRTFVNLIISPFKPLFSDWTMARVTSAGYSVAYAINDQTKREVDRTYIALKLYPPGEEDYFSPKDLGYYWHLRYYPDYFDMGGKAASRSLEQKNPKFAVRVVKNKDIVFTGLMGMNNILEVEGVLFNIKDVKPCVSITFIRDPGVPVIVLGGLLALAGLVLRRRQRVTP